MANSYSKLLIQIVFAPKYRAIHFDQSNCDRIGKYMFGIAQKHKMHPIAIKCLPDHIHIFVHLHSTQSVSQIVRELKAISSKWINGQPWCTSVFQWQSGYGAFSYSSWDKEKIKAYVLGQEEHHRKTLFRYEYRKLLLDHGIDFNEAYFFDDGIKR